MSYGEAGFLLGALPGAAMVVRNMWYGRSLQKRVEAVAWKEHAWNDTLNRSEKRFLMSDPGPYIGPNDSPEMVKAKRELLAALPGFRRRHWICGGIMFAGALFGVLAGTAIDWHIAGVA
ncbi:hypothetical protein [Lysobacter solisilvae (ex Woo and Kim 2020)]|uniref:Uncharacterized protein n=1 Tax=Agrilutibacter terrestris TaxID=2865112 RepID=A0A7H0FVY5_9GAMM|nr:hypothetical protein [Lysobacter terrestris]QNP40201.1 hypothetical protein H8B22_11990 [Lysobacter terrestris]